MTERIESMRYSSIYSWRDRCPERHVRAVVATCGIARGCNTPNPLAIDWTTAGSLEELRCRNAKVARRSSARRGQLSCALVLICPTRHRHASRIQIDQDRLTSWQWLECRRYDFREGYSSRCQHKKETSGEHSRHLHLLAIHQVRSAGILLNVQRT